MSTPIRKPRAKVSINGVNVAYKTVSVSYAVNRLASFHIGAQVPNLGFLGLGDIISVGKQAQTIFINEISSSNTSIELFDGKSSCTLKGYITSVTVDGTTLGRSANVGISGVAEDGFAAGFDPSIYKQCSLDETKTIQVVDQVVDGNYHWAVAGMPREATSSVCQRLQKACEFAIAKGQPAADINPLSKQIVNVALQNNKNCWKYLKAILERSADTSKVLNGVITSESCVPQINNAIAQVFFDRGLDGFSGITMGLNPVFLMYYLPSLKDGKGIVKTYNLDPSKETQSINDDTHSISLNTGITQNGFLPLKSVVVGSRGSLTDIRINDQINASASLTSLAMYPKEVKGFGRIKCIEPPSFLKERAVVLAKEESTQPPSSGKMNSVPRSETQNQEATKEEGVSKEAAKSIRESLTEYAKQKYFELKYGSSQSTISCPANVGADLKLGEITAFHAKGKSLSGKSTGLCSGLLSAVSHTFNHGGVCSTTYSLSQVRIGGN